MKKQPDFGRVILLKTLKQYKTILTEDKNNIFDTTGHIKDTNLSTMKYYQGELIAKFQELVSFLIELNRRIDCCSKILKLDENTDLSNEELLRLFNDRTPLEEDNLLLKTANVGYEFVCGYLKKCSEKEKNCFRKILC